MQRRAHRLPPRSKLSKGTALEVTAPDGHMRHMAPALRCEVHANCLPVQGRHSHELLADNRLLLLRCGLADRADVALLVVVGLCVL